MSDIGRLMNKIVPEPNSGCWVWTGSIDRHGYGNFWFRGTYTKAHRASYVLHKGSIPSGRSGTQRYDIDHLCRVSGCVNPDHLELVTHAVNCERGTVNQHRDKTHCDNGHALDEANVWLNPRTGQRCCRSCARQRDQKYRAQPEAKALALLRGRRYRQRIKAAALALGLLAFPFRPAQAQVDVWLFYGAGPHIFSTGIDTIARWARHTRGVSSVHVSDYRDTQAAYDFLRAQPSDHRVVIIGYSCGGNASLVVGGSLNRTVHLALLQPSIWCGRYGTTSNMALMQDTYSYRTGGLGAYLPTGNAQRNIYIERQDRHLRGDNNRDYQRDALAVVTATANPDRRHAWFWNRLRRTTVVEHQRGNSLWLEGVE